MVPIWVAVLVTTPKYTSQTLTNLTPNRWTGEPKEQLPQSRIRLESTIVRKKTVTTKL